MPPSPPVTILYIGSRLPARSETFVYREMLGLRKRGRTVIAASVHRPAAFDDDPMLAAIARDATVIYDWRTLAALPIAALLHPLLIARAVRDALTADHSSPANRAKHVVQALAGIATGWRLRGRGIGAVHAHMANVPATIALYVARALGARFSFTGHAADLFVQRSALAFKLREAAFVASISHWHRRFYEEIAPLPADRRPLVRCSVALPEHIAGERREIVAVARLVAKKGIAMLVEAFAAAKLPGWTLRILGDGPERGALERLAAARGVADAVQFEGPRPHAACLDAISTAGMVVLPCRTAGNRDRDGIPVVLMEAMAAGRAVIAGDLPTIRELVRDGENGLLVPPDDTASLTLLIRKLADDAGLRRTLGMAARESVASEFGDDLNLDRLEAAFDASALVAR